MEDSTQAARRGRPGSSSRMTPTPTISTSSSANNSSRDLLTPRREGGSQTSSAGNGRGSSGASLLQERLRERKVESAKAAANRMSVDLSPAGERGVHSSPVRGSTRDEKSPNSGGIGNGAPGKGMGMGVKQMEEQVSTLHKQNFDLKLELYHRRQRQEALEARLEAAERQIEEQAELQEVNEQLLAELERRDQALDEAVGVIVGLEDKVDRLLTERDMVRSVDAQPFEVPPTEAEEISTSPPAPETKPEKSKSVVRMPSFLSEKSEGTEALRSLYLPRNRSYSDATLPQLLEEGAIDGMNSPRLSVLSKSSFLSVYGEQPLDLNDESNDSKGHRQASSVEKWVDGAPLAATPRVSPDISRNQQFLSINDVLESPLQRLEKLRHTLEKHSQPEQRPFGNEKRRAREVSRRAVADKSSFDQQQMLPPTPDTISTSTLRLYQNSNEALGFDHTAFLNKTLAFTPGLTHNTHHSALSMRPRSAGETVTSRREGHGWDTETQEDLTETCSIGSTSSTFSASAANTYRPRRVPTPDLFNFSSNPADLNWERDDMFNEPSLPAHKPSGNGIQDRSRRYSISSDMPSDDVVMPNSHNHKSTYTTEQTQPSALFQSPLGTSPRPDLPDRRSSLSAISKLRRPPIQNQLPNPSSVYSSPAPSSNNIFSASAPSTVKKPRLTTRLFRRGDQDSLTPIQPQPTVSQYQDSNAVPPQVPTHGSISNGNGGVGLTPQRPRFGTLTATSSFSSSSAAALPSRSHSYLQPQQYSQFVQAAEPERATPPPIRRSRTATSATGHNGRERPSSAGTGSAGVVTRRESRAQRDTGKTYVLSRDGASDGIGRDGGEDRRRERGVEGVEVAEAAEGEKNSSSGRKWFGSLRRN